MKMMRRSRMGSRTLSTRYGEREVRVSVGASHHIMHAVSFITSTTCAIHATSHFRGHAVHPILAELTSESSGR